MKTEDRRVQHKGILFRARKKSARCPEMRGKLTIDGREYLLSAWEDKDVYGQPRLSLRATER